MRPKTKDKALSEKRSLRELERRRSNREAILHAAEAVIIRKGMSSVSMDDVAAEAGFSKATIYKYVPSKSELVFELMIHFMEDMDARLRLIAANPLKPEAKLLAFLREVLRFQAEKENLARAFILDQAGFRVIHVMAGEKSNPPTETELGFLRRLLAARQAVTAHVESFLREGIKTGAFHPMRLESGVRYLSAVIQGYQHDKFSGDPKPDLEKDVLDIHGFILHGIKAEKQVKA